MCIFICFLWKLWDRFVPEYFRRKRNDSPQHSWEKMNRSSKERPEHLYLKQQGRLLLISKRTLCMPPQCRMCRSVSSCTSQFCPTASFHITRASFTSSGTNSFDLNRSFPQTCSRKTTQGQLVEVITAEQDRSAPGLRAGPQMPALC